MVALTTRGPVGRVGCEQIGIWLERPVMFADGPDGDSGLMAGI